MAGMRGLPLEVRESKAKFVPAVDGGSRFVTGDATWYIMNDSRLVLIFCPFNQARYARVCRRDKSSQHALLPCPIIDKTPILLGRRKHSEVPRASNKTSGKGAREISVPHLLHFPVSQNKVILSQGPILLLDRIPN